MDLKELTHEHFANLQNQKFRISAGTASVEAELIEVTKWERRRKRARDPFSLIFRGPMAPWFNQQICKVENEALGSLEIFLVPIGPDEVGMRYEAVFT